MGEFTVTVLDELEGRELAAFDVTGNRIAIAKTGDSYYAFGDTCTHEGVRSQTGSSKERPSPAPATEASST
jgi:nitrite reductase/ring-hydroxylating ferredoxin subunit